jgi:replicative DNA helicase
VLQVVEEIQAALSSKADSADVERQLASKADVATLEKVSGGSASALEGIQEGLQELQQAQRLLQNDLASCTTKEELEMLLTELEAKAAKAELAKMDADVRGCEQSLQNCMQELEAIKATSSQLKSTAVAQNDFVALHALVDGKADRKDLDKVTGGSAGALKSLESSIQAIQSQAKDFADRRTLAIMEKQTADLAKSITEKLQALEQDLGDKENAKTAEKARSNTAIVLDAVQSDLVKLREAVGDLSVVDQMQALEAKLRSKAEAGKMEELAADVDATKRMLQNVTGSEQMAEVQRRLDTLTKAVQEQGEQSADNATVQQLQQRIQELASVTDNAVSGDVVASLKVGSWPIQSCFFLAFALVCTLRVHDIDNSIAELSLLPCF